MTCCSSLNSRIRQGNSHLLSIYSMFIGIRDKTFQCDGRISSGRGEVTGSIGIGASAGKTGVSGKATQSSQRIRQIRPAAEMDWSGSAEVGLDGELCPAGKGIGLWIGLWALAFLT